MNDHAGTALLSDAHGGVGAAGQDSRHRDMHLIASRWDADREHAFCIGRGPGDQGIGGIQNMHGGIAIRIRASLARALSSRADRS